MWPWTRRRAVDTASTPEPTGYAVRTDWPDGTHLIFGWRRAWRSACRLLFRDHRYWRSGPIRPHTWSVVGATRTVVAAHPRSARCSSPQCPRGVPLAGPGIRHHGSTTQTP